MPANAYELLDSGACRASLLTRGPWHPEHQHAGPPIALVCRAIERVAAGHGLTHIARLTSAMGGPACWCSGCQGPRVSKLARQAPLSNNS
jgi:hypothetical protein